MTVEPQITVPEIPAPNVTLEMPDTSEELREVKAALALVLNAIQNRVYPKYTLTTKRDRMGDLISATMEPS